LQGVALLLLLLAVGCRGAREPVLLPLREASPKTPVVLLPGLTGTVLRDVESGRVVWGNARSFFFPRDGGYATSVPLTRKPGEQEALEPVRPILEIRLFGLYKRNIYRSLSRLMELNGYRPGELHSPGADDDFFFFVYDWRLGVEHAARSLSRQLERLREARGDERLRVSLICQSDASLIARYYLKYGGASIEEAEAGNARPPSNVEIEKLILVGTANGGSLRVLHEMNRGRIYVRTFGRRWQPETLFTFPSLYQSLPVHREDLFFDSDGEPLAVDLFDPEDWERYGWAIFGSKARQRIVRRDAQELFGEPDDWRRFLATMLDRSQRLHRLLSADVADVAMPRYYSIQNRYRASPERALITRADGSWRTEFFSDRSLQASPLWLDLAVAAGDGHATVASQNWLSPRERAALAHPPAYVDGAHFGIILEPATQQKILEFLLD
jgi:hypothetical protein